MSKGMASFLQLSPGGFISGAVVCWAAYVLLSLTLDAINDSVSTWLFYGLPIMGLAVGVAAVANPGMRSFGKGWLWGFFVSVLLVFAGAASFS